MLFNTAMARWMTGRSFSASSGAYGRVELDDCEDVAEMTCGDGTRCRAGTAGMVLVDDKYLACAVEAKGCAADGLRPTGESTSLGGLGGEDMAAAKIRKRAAL